MGTKKKSISRKNLIKLIAKKTGITKKKARKAFQIILKEGASFKKQKLKVVKVKKEVPVEVIKEVTIVREIDKSPDLAKKKNRKANKAKAKKEDKKKKEDKSKLRIAAKAPIKKTKAKPEKSKGEEQKKTTSKKENNTNLQPKTISKPVRKPKVLKDEPPKKEMEIEEKVEEFQVKPAAPQVKRSTPPKKPDDLTKIEGIGPAISRLLKADGIITFRALANAEVSTLQGILDKAGSRFRIHNPGTWPQQSALAADGKWDELKQLQDRLKGGR